MGDHLPNQAGQDSGTLYVVATPIGNIKDISYRAVEILSAVDVIAAEDTRHSAGLLQQYNIRTHCIALHEHNERNKSAELVTQLVQGQTIALISDAGTPLVSDPGYHLVKLARENSIAVVPVPGPCALTVALSASGLPSDRFIFEGFLPAKAGARQKKLENLKKEPRTLIFYEAPHRIAACLGDMSSIFGADRSAVVARELTKTFETIKSATLVELVTWVAADSNQQRGEIVVLVGGCPDQVQEIDPETDRLLTVLLEELSTKQASAAAAKISGLKKKILYERALQLLNKKPG